MKNILLIAGLLISGIISAQKGKMFPPIEGVDLNGKTIKIPIPNGKETVVAMVFQRSAEDDQKKWLNPLHSTFSAPDKKSSQFDMTNSYDVNFVYIPVIGGIKKVKSEYMESTDKGFWPFIMDTDKTDMKLLAKNMGISDREQPYIFVLDKSGKILEVQSGKFSEDKMDKIEEACGGD
ncbi:MAG: hypothetical protein IPM51_14115 [Sphingobacteriaceae bacterium]|nr:hypothetical protein [Sphingobacteriaceae bacterium]